MPELSSVERVTNGFHAFFVPNENVNFIFCFRNPSGEKSINYMANKEQCESCGKYKRSPYGMKCMWYGRKPSFDSTECSHFEKNKESERNGRFEKGKEKEQQPLTSIDDAYRYALMSLKIGKHQHRK